MEPCVGCEDFHLSNRTYITVVYTLWYTYKMVDLWGIEPQSLECKTRIIPLYYKPVVATF